MNSILVVVGMSPKRSARRLTGTRMRRSQQEKQRGYSLADGGPGALLLARAGQRQAPLVLGLYTLQ
ncbi:hypothetical protein [Streptomyces sp. NBC_00203]|uniref:hypothetical protein n=1 Tax=Streptomyces sp. NBC_00203 TaxID=2975680 RepID=UPI0032457300